MQERLAGGCRGRHLEIMSYDCVRNPTASIEAYLLEEQSCQIFHPDSMTEPKAFAF